MATQKDRNAGNAQSGQEENRQGVIPGEEAGELDSGLGGIGSLSTGHAGSLQSERELEPAPGEKQTR
jgi:hypothetical protein